MKSCEKIAFNYQNCKNCKKNNSDIIVELSKLLPVSVCNKIGEYNIYCHKCNNLFKREKKMTFLILQQLVLCQ